MVLQSRLSFSDILGHFVVWIILTVLTGGLILFFYPYAFFRFILNSLVIDNHRVRCDINIGSQIGHIVLWFFLSIITFGLALPFYVFSVWREAVSNAVLDY